MTEKTNTFISQFAALPELTKDEILRQKNLFSDLSHDLERIGIFIDELGKNLFNDEWLNLVVSLDNTLPHLSGRFTPDVLPTISGETMGLLTLNPMRLSQYSDTTGIYSVTRLLASAIAYERIKHQSAVDEWNPEKHADEQAEILNELGLGSGGLSLLSDASSGFAADTDGAFYKISETLILLGFDPIWEEQRVLRGLGLILNPDVPAEALPIQILSEKNEVELALTLLVNNSN